MTRLPDIIQELLDLRSVEVGQAVSLVRRSSHCSVEDARELVRLLPAVEAVARFPDAVACLLGEPQPSLLAGMKPHREDLLRLVRRGRRLDAIRLVTETTGAGSFEARRFCDALCRFAAAWTQLAAQYARPVASFWARPLPEPPAEREMSVTMTPDVLDPELLLTYLRQGEVRAATLWVRRLSGWPREECQELVDRLDDMVHAGVGDPWGRLAQNSPDRVAELAGLPNPFWLARLEGVRSELLGLNTGGRKGQAAELVAATVGCSVVEARRFLGRLGDGSPWDSTRELFRPDTVKPVVPAAVAAPATATAAAGSDGARAALPPKLAEPAQKTVPAAPAASSAPAASAPPKPPKESTPKRPAALPVQAVSEDSPAPLQLTERQESPPPAAASKSLLTKLPAKAPDAGRAAAAAVAAVASPLLRPGMPTLTPPAAFSVSSSRVPESGGFWSVGGHEEPPALLRIDDLEAVAGRLGALAEACSARDTARARALFGELEQAGFNRSWIQKQAPALLPFLPPEPWSEQLDHLGEAAGMASAFIKGDLSAGELASRAAGSLHLEKAAASFRQAVEKRDLTALGQAAEEAGAGEQVAWLNDVMDQDDDGVNDLVEIRQDPVAYFKDLVQKRHPELLVRLGDEKIARIQTELPELVKALKARNMRNVMKTMGRLKLGPGDIKTVINILKTLIGRR